MGEFVFDDDFVATTTAGCVLSIFDPNENLVFNGAMTASSTGWTYYNYVVPSNGSSGIWPTQMACGSAINGDLVKVDKSFIVDWSVVSTSTIKGVVDESLAVATSSLSAVINAHTDAQAAGIVSAVNLVTESASSSLPSSIWSFTGRTLTSFGTLVADMASAVWGALTRRLTDATLDSGSLATQSYIDTATSTLAAKIQSGYTVTLSDFEGTTVNTAYKAKLQVLNYATVPTDADSLPTVVITDSAGTVQAPPPTPNYMTKDSAGTYSYSYSIGGSAVGGVWETVVSAVVNGETVKVNDYWNLSSSPADVSIIEITDKIIPAITASVRIDNMGTSNSDFYYVYCIVSSENNLCGGNDDIDSGSDTAYIIAGSFVSLSLTLDEVPTAGTYWFKVRARALAETNWAAATEQFIASSAVVAPSCGDSSCNGSETCSSCPADCGQCGGGGGGGGGGGLPAPIPTPVAVCTGADFNHDGIVNSVDFSILLYFWKTQPPFKNACVDINKDRKVDSVDFSIMLYQWGKKGTNLP